eukprot:765075-Hanusia_phi.AAC.2
MVSERSFTVPSLEVSRVTHPRLKRLSPASAAPGILHRDDSRRAPSLGLGRLLAALSSDDPIGSDPHWRPWHRKVTDVRR